jgi:glycosyltransferase involved in cell wall biosynthesis
VTSRFGIVLIGRNEGCRLQNSIHSLLNQVDSKYVVYVDSGSSDKSPDYAEKLGIKVIYLDNSLPFSAARSRNNGAQTLLALYPDLEYIQFIDGDCELASRWIMRAQSMLAANPKLAIVCGRRWEKFPNKSIYNKLCNIEWNTPIGETKYCGGDFMIRVSAFKEVGGFNPAIVAGEEPELCVRLRKKGWKILHINADMTFHDANIMYFTQWWKRSERSGYAYAQGTALHGGPPEYYRVRENLSIWLWSCIFPVIIIYFSFFIRRLSLFFIIFYLFLFIKIYLAKKKTGMKHFDSIIYSLFCILIKFPQFYGQLKFLCTIFLSKEKTIMEYK